MKTILIVDDEEDNRMTMKGILENNKYKVITARNGEDCLTRLKKEKVDLILLDVMMPGMTTQKITEKLKGNTIIYVTAVQLSDSEKKDLLKNKNVADFVQKPYDMKDLLRRVKKALS